MNSGGAPPPQTANQDMGSIQRGGRGRGRPVNARKWKSINEPIGSVRGNPVYTHEDGPYAFLSSRQIGVRECVLCGGFEYDGDDIDIHGSSVCDPCSSIIMNLKHHKHSGEYVTWPNQSRDPEPRDPAKNISPSLRRRVHERDHYACRYCGARQELEVDHIVPVTRGGGKELDNLTTACHTCNQYKFNRTPGQAGMVLHPPETFA